MNPKTAVYLKAQAAILRSSGISIREKAKILKKMQELGSEVLKFTRVLRQTKEWSTISP